jgi:acyl-CoA dehydrogenase
MNFDFSEDQKLLQKTARDFLTEHAPLLACRRVLESEHPMDAKLYARVAEMGWLGAAVPEEHGGAGMGSLELAVLAEEIGRALAPIPFGSSVYMATEALRELGSPAQQKEYLPALAAGERIGTWAIAEGAGQPSAASVRTELRPDGTLVGTKRPVLDGGVAHLAVVLARDGGSHSLVLAPLDHATVTRTPLRSIDPSRGQAEIRFDGTPVERLGASGMGLALADGLLDRAAALTAFEQIGAATRAFEMTQEFCMGRYAFGRPIASFQALKHRLADLYCALELARSNAYYAAWALHARSPELGTAACGARVSATTALDLAATEMIQMYGGVGFTWEYDCQLFYRRAKLLGLCLGSPSVWREKLMRRLEAGSGSHAPLAPETH